MMKSSKLTILALAGLFGATMTTPALVHAQETAAGQEMHESGAAAKGALNDAGSSVKHMYRATKYEVSDAALTTKVKSVLLKDSEITKFGIHVKSNQGTVTLSGAVDSPAAAAHAQSVAADVKGVQSVNNRLTWHTSAR
jgi:hyperosmotically inducible periplasmic protein